MIIEIRDEVVLLDGQPYARVTQRDRDGNITGVTSARDRLLERLNARVRVSTFTERVPGTSETLQSMFACTIMHNRYANEPRTRTASRAT